MIALDELKSLLWGAAVLLRGKINATGYKEYIFPLVFFKRISDVHNEERARALELGGGDEEFADQPENYSFAIPPGCLWEDVRGVTENVGQTLVTAWTRIERANPGRVAGARMVDGLAGIFGKRDHWTNKNVLPDATVSDLVEHFSRLDLSLANCPADEMGTAYEYLVGKFADDAGHTAQEFYTNRTVVELMAEILDPKGGESIYDPTCGTGGMLVSCIARCKRNNGNWREIKAYGQEQNALTAAIARMNLFLHGIEEFQIVNDDTLQHPGFLDAGRLKTFDAVLANPPYSIKQWNRDLFSNDPFGRNFLGTPPQGRADYAFIQHILKSMNPQTGRCAILLPHGVLFREEERDIRKNLIESDLLEAVIGLGPNLFYNSPMEACIMICRARKPAAAQGRILFINAVNEVTRKNAASLLEPRHIAKILDAYVRRASDGVFSCDAPRDKIAANGFSLSIPLYAHATTMRSDDGGVRSLKEALESFEISSPEALRRLSEFFSALDTPPSVPESPRKGGGRSAECGMGSRGEAGPRRVKLGDVAAEVREKWSGPLENVPVVGLEHLDPDDICLRQWGNDAETTTFSKAFRKGQILLGRRRVYQKKLSVAPGDGICSGDITVIKADAGKILPELLPFYLRTDRFFDYAMQGSAGSLSPRVKWAHLAKYEFDIPPIERQHELADLLWAANDLKEAYKKAIAATDEMLKAQFREMFGECGGRSAAGGIFLQEKAEKGHRHVCLSEVAEITSGLTKNPHRATFMKKMPYLRVANVYFNHLDTTDIAEIGVQDEEIPSALLKKDDLLFVEGNGSLEQIGRVALWDGRIAPILHQNHIIKVRFSNKIIPYYALYFFMSPFGRAQIIEEAKATTGLHTLSTGKIKNFKIPVPPLSLQREFVAIAEKAEVAKAALKKSLADLDQVMKGLINQ